MELYLKIFLAGWVILIVAIVLNIVEMKLGISTWYSFLQESQKLGLLKAFSNATLISKFFLFLIYPLVLGIAGFLILKK